MISPSPGLPRAGVSVVWTGTEAIFWGGQTVDEAGTPSEQLADGLAYDPSSDTWREIPAAPIAPRQGNIIVWTGSEVVIWGGWSIADGSRTLRADGAAYDPATDSWRAIADAPIPPRVTGVAVWTGDEVLVWGGWMSANGEEYDGRGAAFDPDTNAWRELPPAPLPAGFDSTGVWTGEELVVLTKDPAGLGGDQPPLGSSVAAYAPDTGSWRQLAPAPGGCCYGSGLLLDGKLYWPSPGLNVGSDNQQPAYGGVYDLESDMWMPHAPAHADAIGFEPLPVGAGVLLDNLLYDARTDSWSMTPDAPLSAREGAVQVWTGNAAIAWGGVDLTSGSWSRDGAALDLAGDPAATATESFVTP